MWVLPAIGSLSIATQRRVRDIWCVRSKPARKGVSLKTESSARVNRAKKPPMKGQFVGSVLGQCLGDALGFPVEGHRPASCEQYVRDFVRTGRVVTTSRGHYAFGQYTDDSQLARELLQSFVACRGFDPADYAQR